MSKTAVIGAIGLLLASIGAIGIGAKPAGAQQAAHEIPQSMRLAHEETIAELTAIAKRGKATAPIARKALEVLKAHFQREEEYILPPLTLLPALADGRVTPDMKWAIAMADRIKTDRETIFAEHTVITEWMSQLATAAEKSHERDVIAFARAAVADSLNDTEVTEPAAIMVGEYLRAKLGP